MKIKYITNARIPTEKAHGYQICKMCAELAACGNEVELIVPTRKNEIKEDAFSFYGLSRNFKIIYIRSFDALRFVKYIRAVSFYLQSFLFLLKLVFFKINKDDIIYTRTPEITWLYGWKKNKTFYEAHNWPQSKVWLYKFLIKGTAGIISNSEGTATEFHANGFKNILVAPNGVDLKDFVIDKNQQELRYELGLPTDKKIILYVGHLYRWKGANTIIATAELMQNDASVIFVLVGGTQEDIKRYEQLCGEKNLSNVLLYKYQKHEIIPRYLIAADILLLPNAAITEESIKYTSPIKSFEYMASGRPIIASDLPSLKKILEDDSAVFFKSEDASDLASKIKLLLGDRSLAGSKAERAHAQVKNYTWEKRAQRILEFINDYGH